MKSINNPDDLITASEVQLEKADKFAASTLRHTSNSIIEK